MPLKAKQQRFVREYLVDRNATAAYKRAGYKATGHGAEVNAEKLLRNAEVRAEIAQGEAELAQKTGITAKKVLEELALVGFSDVGHILDFSQTDPSLRPANEIPESARRAITSVKVRRVIKPGNRHVEVTEFKLWDKLSALEKIGKHLGMWQEKTPLEVLLASLPPNSRRIVSESLSRDLLAGGSEEGAATDPKPS